MPILNLLRPITRKIRQSYRKISRPISKDEAEEKKAFYSKIYLACSALMAGYVLYLSRKVDVDLFQPNKPVRYIKIKNFTIERNEVLSAEESKIESKMFSRSTTDDQCN